MGVNKPKMDGICRICGQDKNGIEFKNWVKDTFTNYDLLVPGKIICMDCLFWFDQQSEELQKITGKDKPQKMQNYSHFIVKGEWQPVGKGDKARMAEYLLSVPFPEMAAIAVSGQKHIAFRARRNPSCQCHGWVQFEENPIWIEPNVLREFLSIIEALYKIFSKGEIESGHYYAGRVMIFGLENLRPFEEKIKPIRGTAIFQLALFLAQRRDDGTTGSGECGETAQDHLEGDSGGLQAEISHDDLAAVRE
jgi:hypothetical protein